MVVNVAKKSKNSRWLTDEMEILPFDIDGLNIVSITALLRVVVEHVEVFSQRVQADMFEKLQTFVSLVLKLSTVLTVLKGTEARDRLFAPILFRVAK
jgi:hypothetical protein